MPCDAKKVIEVAKSQIGYLEKETWEQLDEFTANAGDGNYVKYSRDLAVYNFYNGTKKGVAWCDIFTDWCFMTAYGVNAAYKLLCQPKRSSGAGCKYSANYYKSKKQWYTSNPQPGDQIFFWPADHKAGDTAMQHTGLVVDVDKTYVYTVEGNTSADSGVVWNGGSVNDKKYKLSYERIAGYGRPDYANIEPDKGYENSSLIEEAEQSTEEKDMYIGTAMVAPKTGKTVNFRKSPSKTAGRVAGCVAIPAGKQVNVKTTDGTWAAVEYNGYKGYMMTEFLVMTLFESEGPEQGQTSTEKTVDEIVSEITQLLAVLAAKAK